MKFFSLFSNQPKRRPATKAPTATVRRIADNALRHYAQTFKDLARYDRGEPIPHSLSR